MTRYNLSASDNWLNSADAAVRDQYVRSAHKHAARAGDEWEKTARAAEYAGRHELNILRRTGRGLVEGVEERFGGEGGAGGDGRAEKKDWQAFKPLVLKSQQHEAEKRMAASGSGQSNSHVLDGFYSIGKHRQYGTSGGAGAGTSSGNGGRGTGWAEELAKSPGSMLGIAAADAGLMFAGFEYGKHRERKKSASRATSKGTGVYEMER
ncbi:hypothetical protein JCM6882_001910 [Rhodosporidiobolus microsporus]